MDQRHSMTGIGGFWFLVAFAAGAYWGISFFGGVVSHSLVIWAPIGLCLGTAIIGGGGWRGTQTIGVAMALYMTFWAGFGIGYGSAQAGIVRFGYRNHRN